MSSIKNPQNEAEVPAPKPPRQHTKMAPRKDAPPGLEQDSHGDTIALSQRTKEDQARTGRKNA